MTQYTTIFLVELSMVELIWFLMILLNVGCKHLLKKVIKNFKQVEVLPWIFLEKIMLKN